MNGHYTYKVTSDDVRDVGKTCRIVPKGREASTWRVLMVIGIFLICVPIWNHNLEAAFAFFGGCLIIFLGLLKPIKKRRGIMRSFLVDEVIAISIQPKTIPIRKGGSQKNYPTNEIDFLSHSTVGLLLGFYDKSAAWLPKRVFANQEEMNSCKANLVGKIEESED